MIYICILFFIFNICSSVFIYKKCSTIKNSKDSQVPLYELLVFRYHLPKIVFYILPNLILFTLILFFRFYNSQTLNIYTIYELLLVFTVTQIGYYLICRDLKTFIIPNKVTFPTIIALTIYSLIPPFFNWQNIIFALIAFGIIFILQIINPKGIGGGDAKLCAILGFMMGSYIQSLFFVLAGFVLGGLISLMFMAFKLIKRKDVVPYGLYFYIGACLIYTFANFIFI